MGESGISNFLTIIDAAADPPRAFKKMENRPNTLVAILVLAITVIAGALIQAPVVAAANAEQMQKAFAQGRGAQLSEKQRAQMVAEAANPPLAAQLVNPAIYLGMIFLGVAAEAGLATLALVFIGGTPNFGKLFVAFTNIAVWCLGLYYLGSSIIIRAGFATEKSDAVFPSVLTLFNEQSDLFVRGALATLNIFFVLAIVLHSIGIREIGHVRANRAYFVAAILAIAEIVASGSISEVFG
jgi:hypothetical protein